MTNDPQTHPSSPADTNRRMVILTDGHSNPLTAKTACCVLRFCPDDVVAVLDRESAGQTAEAVLGVGGTIPVSLPGNVFRASILAVRARKILPGGLVD